MLSDWHPEQKLKCFEYKQPQDNASFSLEFSPLNTQSRNLPAPWVLFKGRLTHMPVWGEKTCLQQAAELVPGTQNSSVCLVLLQWSRP